ncbi:AAA family ATPase [Paenibacillus sp. PR3]|uniref:Nuclease SbcCD subunit C n=1 Tax=Paenibacillus terricola TaxID=2763503 RepID=A0ABR8MRC6_9BACL|nr:AAA family ATPase [Paenibacillus terricola]MBD3917586.1 AAA family ATPase [Paenibacillus terricola]
MTNNKFIICKVHIMNFRGYKEKSFDLFSNKETQNMKNGIILISGSNGFGKTTLLDAIEWCLTGTVRRLESEFLRRKENSKSLQLGLIKNNSSRKGDSVSVEIEAYFNGKNVSLIRTFNATTEKNGFNLDETNFSFKIEGNEYAGKTVDDLFFTELDEEVKVSKYFYDRHICTFDKNLKIYNNSREDFYQSFSLFFGGTEEIEIILNNLNGFEEKQGKTKNIKIGLIDELNNKINTDRESLETVLQTLNQEKNNFTELKQEIALVSNLEAEIKKSPREIYFNGEQDAEYYYYHEDELEKRYALCKDQRMNYEYLEKVLLATNVETFIRPELESCIANNELINFRKKVREPFERNANLISLIQSNDLQENKERKYSLESEISKIQDYTRYNNESHVFIDQIQKKYGLDERIINITSQLQERAALKEKYANQIKGFETNERSTKALRALVDHIKGFEQIRHNGHEKCPLCGSTELFIDQHIELAEEAKTLLGAVDEARASLANELASVEDEMSNHFSELKGLVLNVLNDMLRKVTLIVNAFSQMDTFIMEINKHSLNLRELTAKKIFELEREIVIRAELKTPLTQDQLNKIQSVYKSFENTKNEEYWELYNQLTAIQKIEIFKEFIELSTRYTENFLELHQPLLPLKDINLDNVKLKINILKKIENELKNDELIKKADKIIIELEGKRTAINNEINIKEKKLTKLKEIQRELREIRNKWDKLIGDQINEPMQRIFKRLSRHTNIESINLMPEGRTTQKTNVTVTVDGGKEMYVPNVLSAGQLSMVSLSMFLTVAMGQKQNPFRCYFLDDPIQSMDDLNVLSFVDLLRVEQNDKERFFDQLFITTCNEDLEKLIAHKMKTFGVNLCHLKFDGYGEYRNLEY